MWFCTMVVNGYAISLWELKWLILPLTLFSIEWIFGVTFFSSTMTYIMSMTNKKTLAHHSFVFGCTMHNGTLSINWFFCLSVNGSLKLTLFASFLFFFFSFVHSKLFAWERELTSYLLSDEVFEYRRFASTLTSDHSNLWQIQLHMHAQWCECILQLIHNWNERFHSRVTRHCLSSVICIPLISLIQHPIFELCNFSTKTFSYLFRRYRNNVSVVAPFFLFLSLFYYFILYLLFSSL